ncbi:dihydrolipoamide acetyltransferase family protein [Niabella drilacis]|uniref:Dihydrolipoamide acetyltransferase component of pyruvate dehydrogenase complex n=1 Tax=Niabella drilacis (strain DSM 25811 / CCM 8410 / CCUG 62505 / LMG 26954 / E90) TaxID=1285928 RepID=A0A1G6JDC5_NIADE|nr:dihydrolipoamide acetyltransferase family protein [Niabella drilacis]SDC16673.1 2-oxoglutarate dehydrogenase E2 component (dihydrolipoamide succinyltransferase) [Niabella drilacis]
MALEDLVMPKLGESIMEATILKWLKQVGDAVEMDETVLEIATDKVDSEVPSTASGVIEAILFSENDVVPIGTVIARIRTEGLAEETITPEPAVTPQPVPSVPEQEQEAEVISSTIKPETSGSAPSRFYSPLVLNIAASEGISMSELEKIPGTGKEGRVTKNDILDYVASRSRRQAPAASVTPPAVTLAPAKEAQQAGPLDISRHGGNVEIIEMDRMRKLIAEHMVRSKQTSPHVTSFSEADVTNMVMWREKVKKDFEKREGTKITFMPLFIEAIAKCIKRFPLINSSVEGDKIIIKKDINIGMATALPNGNLIVPVIKNADQLNLTGLAKRVNGLADAARNNKLKAEDTQGGSFTITNVGTFGSLAGTPIINQPQVAILAVGAIKKRPVVVETPQGDSIAIRHMMVLSMSYDHRVVDGALGATFLSAVAKELESFVPVEV